MLDDEYQGDAGDCGMPGGPCPDPDCWDPITRHCRAPGGPCPACPQD